ncbi:MAG TPA: pilus assembly protein N-terminal domain-containing protein, partial [Tepidisphaeraceae bacterium]
MPMSRLLAILAAALMLLVFGAVRATGQQADGASKPAGGASLIADGVIDATGAIRVAANKSTIVTTKVPAKRVSIAQPDIADVNPTSPTSILLTAKKMGTTQLMIWDDADHSQVVDVVVEADTNTLQGQLKTMFPGAKIEVGRLNGAIVLRGTVPSLQAAEQAVAVATPYAQNVLNFLEVSGGQQVMLQVRFAEVSRSATSALGVNGNYASGAFIGGSNIGQLNPSNRMPTDILVGQTPPFNGIQIQSPTPVTPGVTLYGAGQIGNFYLEYFINALRQNNLLRILAEPN